jgi:hypothetical protein
MGPIPDTELSPLQLAITHSKLPVGPNVPLRDFVSWAQQIDLGIAQEVGSVRSVHLYRGRTAIHHEFVLICFEAGDVCSWLRVERAAQVKWRHMEMESLGPLVGGAPLRESVSFSRSKYALSGVHADEVASVALNDPATSPNVNPRMLLDTLASQLCSVSDASPRYQLFKANCRWFARRVILSFAQQLNTLAPGCSTVVWGGKLSSLDDLLLNIRMERFGGRQLLEGPKAALMGAQNLTQLADTYRKTQNYSKALEACQASLTIVVETDADSFNRQCLAVSP